MAKTRPGGVFSTRIMRCPGTRLVSSSLKPLKDLGGQHGHFRQKRGKRVPSRKSACGLAVGNRLPHHHGLLGLLSPVARHRQRDLPICQALRRPDASASLHRFKVGRGRLLALESREPGPRALSGPASPGVRYTNLGSEKGGGNSAGVRALVAAGPLLSGKPFRFEPRANSQRQTISPGASASRECCHR